MNSKQMNQNYCLTKILGQAQLFGDSRRQRNKLDLIEEDKFVGQVFKRIEINLPNTTRSSYIQSYCTFSTDGKYGASNHDNKIYISDLQKAKVVNVLQVQSRCTWNLCFHPVHNHILASGFLGGQVLLFDLRNNASQEWHNPLDYSHHQVISSLCFHPFEDILAIAINNFVHFWNWRNSSGDSSDFVSISTGDLKQKVKFVRFDKTGRLIIGILNDAHSPNDGNRGVNVLNNPFYSEYVNNNIHSNLNSTTSSSISTAAAQQQPNSSTSNLNNLNNISNISLNNLNNLIDRHDTSAASNSNIAIRIVDDFPNPLRINALRSEAFFNLNNAIAESIAQDHLLPDNLPSFAFLQRNYQPANTVTSTMYNLVMSLYRRLESEVNHDNNNESTNLNGLRNELRRNNSSSLNSATFNETNDEELNAIMESTSIIERYINRYRNMQDNESSSHTDYSTLFNLNTSLNSNFNLNMPRGSRRDYIIRRRLSSNRTMESQVNAERTSNDRSNTNDRNSNQFRTGIYERQNLSTSSTPTRSNLWNIVCDSNTNTNTNSTQRNLSDQRNFILHRINQTTNTDNQTVRDNNQQNRSLSVEDSTPSASNDNTLRETLEVDVFSRTIRESIINRMRSNSLNNAYRDYRALNCLLTNSDSRSNGTRTAVTDNRTANNNNRTTNQDNHNRFYTLVQHQASLRSTNNLSNLFLSTPSDQQQQTTSNSHNSSVYVDPSNRTNHISTLINRIQNSIDVIDRANENGRSDNESNYGHTAIIQRLIYYANYRDKLIHFKNRISRLIRLRNDNNNSSHSNINLTHYSTMISTLISFADRMQRILVTDLRFTQLCRLYLMRTSANNSRQINDNNLIDISTNNDSNDSSSSSLSSNSSLQSTSNMQSSSSSLLNDDNDNQMEDQPIPSTSTGITKRKFSNEDKQLRSNKKFKIPVVKNQIDSVIDQNNDTLTGNESTKQNQSNNANEIANHEAVDNESTRQNQQQTTQSTTTNNRNQLRTEMNSLLTNLEILNELLTQNRITSSANTPPISSVTAQNYLAFPIQRVNNPVFNQTFSGMNNSNTQPTALSNNNLPPFNFIPANQWLNYNYNEFNHQQIDNCRIQCFDFNLNRLPVLSKQDLNLIVSKCKIHNDSSVDISRNGDLLCCLVPSESNEIDLCVYSCKKSNLGQCLFIYCSFNSNAISLCFSPSSKYIVCGLSSSRLYNYYNNSTNEEEQIQIGQIFVLSENLANEAVKAKKELDLNNQEGEDKKKLKSSTVFIPKLIPFKSIKALSNDDLFSLTSIKWLPSSGLIYSNGQSLVIFRGNGELESFYQKLMTNNNLNSFPSSILMF